MKALVASMATANLVTWCSPAHKTAPYDHTANEAIEVVSEGEPTLKALSRQGIRSTAELEALGAPAVMFRLDADGTAIAFDFSEYSYDGSTGTELARRVLTADELAAVQDRFEKEFTFLDLSDQQVTDQLAAAQEREKAACPNCEHSYAGDVGTMSIAFARHGQRTRLYYASDMYLPDGYDATAYTLVRKGRAEVLRLRSDVLDTGTGIVPQAVAAAKAAQLAQPDFAGVFSGKDCFFLRDFSTQPPPPDAISCAAYASVNHADDDEVLSFARVEVDQLPAGPATLTKPQTAEPEN